MLKMLTIGTVLLLKGATNKLMIIGRGVRDEDGVLYDYISCVYPDGYSSDETFVFNEDAIDKVIFSGYADEEEEVYMKYLQSLQSKGE